MGITSADIARMAGVSRSAVSAVLNGHYGKVSLAKREKILTIARDLQYRPNRAALILAGRTTRHIGLVASPFLSPIYSVLLSHISFLLSEQGYSSSILTPASKTEELDALRFLESVGAAGIIGTCFFHDIHKIIGMTSVPVLSMSPYPGQYELRADLAEAMRIAVRHLADHGHREIAFLCPSRDTTPLQFSGYLDAVGRNEPHVLEASSDSAFAKTLKRMLRSGVTAFAATNDLLAARFRRFLLQTGCRIPEDVALTGFDGNAYDETFTPPLTSIRFPARRLAERAVARILDKIASHSCAFPEKPELVKPELLPGGTCGCPVKPVRSFRWDGQPLILE